MGEPSAYSPSSLASFASSTSSSSASSFASSASSSQRHCLPDKYLSPTALSPQDDDSLSYDDGPDSPEPSLSPLSLRSDFSDFSDFGSSSCSYLDLDLDLSFCSAVIRGLGPVSIPHEARTLPVAQVIPSKSEQTLPRKSVLSPPSSLAVTPASQSSPYRHGAPRPSVRDPRPQQQDEDKFVSLDATMNQSALPADAEPYRPLWSSENGRRYADVDLLKCHAQKTLSPSYQTDIPHHKRSPSQNDPNPGSPYPAGYAVDALAAATGKTSLDYPLDLPAYSPTYRAGLKSHDLTHWQQQLQQQQLQQQIEQLKLSQTVHTSLPYTCNSGPYVPSLASLPAALPAAPHFGEDPGRLEGVIRAKENLLKEKDLVIERQKLELAHSQEQLRKKQEQERHLMYSRAQEDKGDFLLMKIQEYQYDNANLRAQIAELSTLKTVEIDRLNKRLGETEYEHEQLKKALKEAKESKVKETKDLEQKLIQREAGTEETKAKYSHMKEKYDKLKKRISSLEKYMGDLPTAEQYNKKSETIGNLKEKERLHRDRITQLELALAEARNTVRNRDLTIGTLEGRESDLQIELDSLRNEASRLQSALGAPKDADPSALKLFSRTAMEELLQERDRAQAEVDKLKKMVESKHRQLKAQQAQHQKALEGLEERLRQEEDTVTALRETTRSKEDDLRKMKDSMTALAKQSQELYEHNLDVQERNQALEALAASDTARLGRRLTQELADCVGELHGLVQVCTQTAEGQEPNVSVLLRFRAPSFSSHESEGAAGTELSAESLKAKLDQVQELRAEIDRLRSLVSNKYAEDMGNECITQ